MRLQERHDALDLLVGNERPVHPRDTPAAMYSMSPRPRSRSAPPRIGHRVVDMPPVFLKSDTVQKIQKLWS
jgi:hypothetical protein